MYSEQTNFRQKKILDFFKQRDYGFDPLLLCEFLHEEPYIIRRNVLYLVQQGLLEHKGYQTRINKLLPLYQITELGKEF